MYSSFFVLFQEDAPEFIADEDFDYDDSDMEVRFPCYIFTQNPNQIQIIV